MKRLIAEAFAADLLPAARLTHDDCMYYRIALPALAHEFVRAVLAQVLLDLVDTHTSDYHRIEDADMVVLFLLPVEGPPGSPEDVLEPDPGLEFCKQARESVFALFSRTQAGAILAWLELAMTWGDLLLHHEQIEDAVRFWRSRAECAAG